MDGLRHKATTRLDLRLAASAAELSALRADLAVTGARADQQSKKACRCPECMTSVTICH